MKRITVLLACGAFLVAVGCGSARVVKRTQYGGTIALQGDQNKAMEDAHAKMNAHCGSQGYTITEEGEVVVGSDTAYGEDTEYDEDGSTTEGGSTTRDATEWRVTYECGQAGGPPPAAGPGY
jgi:hypothetical protein